MRGFAGAGGASERFPPRPKAFAQLTIELCSFAAERLQQIAIALLDQIYRLFALAQADDVLDVARPLLPALHRLGEWVLDETLGLERSGSSLPAIGMQKVCTIALL